jgi:hypothetical protein
MRSSTDLSMPSGRWVRQGNRIHLLPAGARAVEGEMETGGGPPIAVPAAYTVCDFIHPNIDVAAQYALFGLLARGPGPRAAALSMLSSVRTGALAGIFQEDQRAPALRARSLGGSWWTLIPAGVGSVCVPGPPPLISFRRSLANNRAALGTELLRVFPTCGLPFLPPPPASGRVCTRPAPATAPGQLRFDPPELNFDTRDTQAGVITRVFRILSSSGTVRWRVRNAPSWMFFDPSAGIATPAGNQIRLTVTPGGLPKGHNARNVWFDSPDAPSADLWVDLLVR